MWPPRCVGLGPSGQPGAAKTLPKLYWPILRCLETYLPPLLPLSIVADGQPDWHLFFGLGCGSVDVSLFLEIYDSPISITLDAGLAYSIVPNEPLPPQPFCFCEILPATSVPTGIVKQQWHHAHAHMPRRIPHRLHHVWSRLTSFFLHFFLTS